MKKCEWSGLTKGSVCIHCNGRPLHRDFAEPPIRECKSVEPRTYREPGLVTKAWNYAAAVAAWALAGSPERTPERIGEILAICQACPHYRLRGERSHCGVCGCALNAAPNGLINKIAMATESCPLTPPKWTADAPPAPS